MNGGIKKMWLKFEFATDTNGNELIKHSWKQNSAT